MRRVWRNCDGHLIVRVVKDAALPENQLPCPHVIDGKIPRVATMSDCVSTVALCLDCLLEGVGLEDKADQLEAKNAKLTALCQKYHSWLGSLCELYLRYWPLNNYEAPRARAMQYEYEGAPGYTVRGHRFRKQAMLWRHFADVLEMLTKEDEDVLSGTR